MSKFEGQASISSADFFGGGPGSASQQSGRNDYLDSGPDIDEIRASVRQGVNKVAGRLSNIANGVMNSIQVSVNISCSCLLNRVLILTPLPLSLRPFLFTLKIKDTATL